MKRSPWLIGASLLALGMSLGQTRIGAQQPERINLKPAELKAISRAVTTPQAVSVTVVSQEFTGNFDSVDENFKTFHSELEKQKVYDNLGAKPSAFLILEEDPTGKSEFKYSLALSTTGNAKVDSPIKKRTFHYEAAVSHIHIGPYPELAQVHSAIRTSAMQMRAKRSTTFPVLLRLVNNPKYPIVDPRKPNAMTKTGPNIRTEVIVPLGK